MARVLPRGQDHCCTEGICLPFSRKLGNAKTGPMRCCQSTSVLYCCHSQDGSEAKVCCNAPISVLGEILTSSVCRLARLLIVNIISSQSLHPVTLVPVMTLAPVFLPLFACSPEMHLEGAPPEQARLCNKM